MMIRKMAALALVAVLGFGAATAAPIIGAKPEEGANNWLVDDAEAVMVYNFKALLGSKLMKGGYLEKMEKSLKNDEKAKEVLEATGIDPLKDLDSFIMSANKLGDNDNSKMRMVLRGKFDTTKVGDFLKKQDQVTASESGKTTVYEIKAGDKSMYGAFHGKGAFVVTMDKDETVALAKDGATKAPKANKELAAALKKFTGKESFAMAVAVTDDLKKKAAGLPNEEAVKAIESLKSLTIAATVAEGVDLAIVGSTSDGDSAKKIAESLDKLVKAGGAFLLFQPKVPQYAKDLYDSIKVDNTRDSVSVKLSISKEVIEKAEKMEK